MALRSTKKRSIPRASRRAIRCPAAWVTRRSTPARRSFRSRLPWLGGKSISSMAPATTASVHWPVSISPGNSPVSSGLRLNADLVADSGGTAVVTIDSDNVSVLATTGLEATISSRLTTRLSYTIDYDSNPPSGAVSTDTLSRFTLVYGFGQSLLCLHRRRPRRQGLHRAHPHAPRRDPHTRVHAGRHGSHGQGDEARGGACDRGRHHPRQHLSPHAPPPAPSGSPVSVDCTSS